MGRALIPGQSVFGIAVIIPKWVLDNCFASVELEIA